MPATPTHTILKANIITAEGRNAVTGSDLNVPFSVVDGTSTQKLTKETDDVNDTN
jgi:hypothetical protein